MGNPIRIVVHHSANLTKEPQFDLTNLYHQAKGFPLSSLGYYVGYTSFIERDGKVLQARTDTEQQAHTKGLNDDSIGICLAGDFNQERPTLEQTIALKNLINQKMREYDILPGNIAGHRMFRSTSCPGANITEQELKNLFTPDLGYYQKLLNYLQEWLSRLLKKSTSIGSEIDDTHD